VVGISQHACRRKILGSAGDNVQTSQRAASSECDLTQTARFYVGFTFWPRLKPLRQPGLEKLFDSSPLGDGV